MRHPLISGMALAAVAALAVMGGPQIQPYTGLKKRVRSKPARKPTRAADRSRKQFLIKGVRP